MLYLSGIVCHFCCFLSLRRQQYYRTYINCIMEIQMGIPPIIDQSNQAANNQPLNETSSYQETKYRWVIVVLTGLALLLNGLINNAITPLQHKMTVIYDVSPGKVSVSIILSFVVFILFNFPANKIMDKNGVRVSFLIGISLYCLGTFFYVLVNVSFNFMILGTLFIGIGQPFLINSPAKVAAYWFFPKNRAFATAIMVGINLFGLGVGFLIPTLVVSQQSVGQEAQQQIGHLYLGYLLFAGACLILTIVFMRSKPQNPPSGSASIEKVSSILQTIKKVKQHRNLWKFFPAYCLGYGTFISFATNSNFIIKPYEYTDVQIAVNGVLLMVIGTAGAILFSLYLKKTYNYKLALRVTSVGSFVMLLVLCMWLNTANVKAVTAIIIAIMGFVVTPTVPICYDLGCELSFPMGEAQVTGLLNGGALLWAFISSAFVSSVIGYGSTKSSFLIIIILSIFVLLSAVLFFFVKIDLKRQDFQKKHTEQMQIKSRRGKQEDRAKNDSARTQPQSISNQSPQKYQKKYHQLLEQMPQENNQSI